jgi:hypothetical protein
VTENLHGVPDAAHPPVARGGSVVKEFEQGAPWGLVELGGMGVGFVPGQRGRVRGEGQLVHDTYYAVAEVRARLATPLRVHAFDQLDETMHVVRGSVMSDDRHT